MAFEEPRKHSSEEVKRMLDRLEQRIEQGKYTEGSAEEAVDIVSRATIEAEEMIDAQFDSMSVDEMAEWSNAWTAWGKEGIFEGEDNLEKRQELQGLLRSGGASPDKLKRFARQIWRTEIVAHFINKLAESERHDRSIIAEQLMAAQIVGTTEDDPIEALTGAMWLDGAIEDRGRRVELAALMEKGAEGNLVSLEEAGFGVESIKVVVGGEFLEVPIRVAGTFEFKKMTFVEGENRIYGQMLNGCRGNLVVMEIGEYPAITDGGFPPSLRAIFPDGPSYIAPVQDSPSYVARFVTPDDPGRVADYTINPDPGSFTTDTGGDVPEDSAVARYTIAPDDYVGRVLDETSPSDLEKIRQRKAGVLRRLQELGADGFDDGVTVAGVDLHSSSSPTSDEEWLDDDGSYYLSPQEAGWFIYIKTSPPHDFGVWSSSQKEYVSVSNKDDLEHEISNNLKIWEKAESHDSRVQEGIDAGYFRLIAIDDISDAVDKGWLVEADTGPEPAPDYKWATRGSDTFDVLRLNSGFQWANPSNKGSYVFDIEVVPTVDSLEEVGAEAIDYRDTCYDLLNGIKQRQGIYGITIYLDHLWGSNHFKGIIENVPNIEKAIATVLADEDKGELYRQLLSTNTLYIGAPSGNPFEPSEGIHKIDGEWVIFFDADDDDAKELKKDLDKLYRKLDKSNVVDETSRLDNAFDYVWAEFKDRTDAETNKDYGFLDSPFYIGNGVLQFRDNWGFDDNIKGVKSLTTNELVKLRDRLNAKWAETHPSVDASTSRDEDVSVDLPAASIEVVRYDEASKEKFSKALRRNAVGAQPFANSWIDSAFKTLTERLGDLQSTSNAPFSLNGDREIRFEGQVITNDFYHDFRIAESEILDMGRLIDALNEWQRA